MLKAILFKDPERFDFNDENNYIDIITNNSIILCEDTRIKYFLTRQIEDICDGKYQNTEVCDYDVGDCEEEPKITNMMEYLPTTIFTLDNEQKITLTVEAPFILTATSIDDIWFAQRTKEDKISIYPFRVFIGHKEVWDEGVEKVYKSFIHGRYGCYEYGAYGKSFSWEHNED